MNQEILNMDFNEIAEEISILNKRAVNYNEILVKVIGIIRDSAVFDSKDSPCIKDQIDNLSKVVEYFKHRNDAERLKLIDFTCEIFEQEKIYAKTFLNPDMIWGIRNRYPEIPNYNSSINIDDLYGYEPLALSIKDGEIISNMSEEDLKNIDKKFDNMQTEFTVTREELENLLDGIGLTTEQKDRILDATIFGIAGQTLSEFEFKGIVFTPCKNGKITVKGSNKAVHNFFGKNIRIAKPSTIFKDLIKKTKKGAKETLTFNGSGGISKFNSLMTLIGILHIGEDAVINYTISGDAYESALGFTADAALVTGGLVITGGITAAISYVLAVTSTGGSVLIATAVGGAGTIAYNKWGSDLKEGIINFFDDAFDDFRNLKYHVDYIE